MNTDDELTDDELRARALNIPRIPGVVYPRRPPLTAEERAQRDAHKREVAAAGRERRKVERAAQRAYEASLPPSPTPEEVAQSARDALARRRATL